MSKYLRKIPCYEVCSMSALYFVIMSDSQTLHIYLSIYKNERRSFDNSFEYKLFEYHKWILRLELTTGIVNLIHMPRWNRRWFKLNLVPSQIVFDRNISITWGWGKIVTCLQFPYILRHAHIFQPHDVQKKGETPSAEEMLLSLYVNTVCRIRKYKSVNCQNAEFTRHFSFNVDNATCLPFRIIYWMDFILKIIGFPPIPLHYVTHFLYTNIRLYRKAVVYRNKITVEEKWPIEQIILLKSLYLSKDIVTIGGMRKYHIMNISLSYKYPHWNIYVDAICFHIYYTK